MARTATRSKRGTTRRPARRAATSRSKTTTGRKKTQSRNRPTSARKTPARSTSSTARGRASTRRRTTQRRGASRKAPSRTSPTTAPKRTASAGKSKKSDIIAVLMKDHREVEQMFSRYERLGDRATKTKKTLVRDVIEELSKHAAVEEQLLYPEMKRNGAQSLADEGIEEHGEVKRLLADLDKMSPDDGEYDEKVAMLMRSVRHHVQEEENEMFPRLREAVDKERLVELGEVADGAKVIAPTRPHPHAPTTPPANVVVGVVAGVTDRVRDAGRKLLDR